ncbi:BREX-2 system adenine-specific DNA-methyltransferase PglX [Myxococcota bacterium]
MLKILEADLLVRAKDPGVEHGLKVSWEREKEAKRTAANFNLWKNRRCTQVAVAWILSVIFVRTLEDRDYLPRRRIAGEGAEDSERQFIAMAPFLTTRDYLLLVFKELSQFDGARDLFDSRHNPVWVLAPSEDAARILVDYFRRPDKKDLPPPNFEGTDTRFLGDLYQDLSEDVRKRFALLQTPHFVEEFILQQTLDPAIEAFGLEDVRLIDPTCGSGHFLLGAFHRIFEEWQERTPGDQRETLALRAAKQIYGCDLNPYAVAVARFRLTLEFLQVARIRKLKDAPRLPLNLCVADSLLHGVRPMNGVRGTMGQQLNLSSAASQTVRDPSWGDHLFLLEDENSALRILTSGFHAVVGNPPYITEKDSEKRDQYRELYTSAAGKFALAAPFTERFFGLAVPDGFVGMINGNSFAKREFGGSLVRDVLPRLDVRELVDMAGAFVPGHTTSTLLLFGRNRSPAEDFVTAVLGKRGELEEPKHPETAPVWSEIVSNHTDVGFDGDYVSVEQIQRSELAQHPWVLMGGGARGLMRKLESASSQTLNDICSALGVMGVAGTDEVYLHEGPEAFIRQGVSTAEVRRLGTGETIRDWIFQPAAALFPHDADGAFHEPVSADRYLWPYKSTLSNYVFFGKRKAARGLDWRAWGAVLKDKLTRDLTIGYAFVATHNHFVLDRSGAVFKQTAPVIKLKKSLGDDDHLALLGLLNSSLACFWMRCVCQSKGLGGQGGGIKSEEWHRAYEFDTTKLGRFPLVERDKEKRLELVQALEMHAESLNNSSVSELLSQEHTAERLRTALAKLRHSRETTRHTMVAIQEELDWLAYRSFGVWDGADVLNAGLVEEVEPGERPFAILAARSMRAANRDSSLTSAWWGVHGHRLVSEVPARFSRELSELWGERIAAIQATKELQLLEAFRFKRRWSTPNWEKEVTAAFETFLLNAIESVFKGQAHPSALSGRQLVADLQRDPRVLCVAEVLADEPTPNLEQLVGRLGEQNGVPHLAALRFSEAGADKHASWLETWVLQRSAAAEKSTGGIAAPPKYDSKDYCRAEYWRLRGRLDVPKEAFVLYPRSETDMDDTPLLGWAGWTPLQRATALAGLYQSRKEEEGWGKDRLVPLLAGLNELVPWLLQWHNESDPVYGKQGDEFCNFVSNQLREFGMTEADLEGWRPPKATPKSKKAKKEAPTESALLDAMKGFESAEVAQKDLVKALDSTGSLVGEVAKACIETGTLEQTKARPKTYRLV